MSAPMRLMPSRPRIIVRSSRVDQPPVSGVPVAGATKGTEMLGICATDRMRQGKARLTGWIKSININRKINRLGKPNTLFDLVDDPMDSNGIDIAGFDDLETAITIILVIRGPRQGRSGQHNVRLLTL